MKNEQISERCPFNSDDCGEFWVQSKHREHTGGGKYMSVFQVCCSCGARGPWGKTREEAIKKWNCWRSELDATREWARQIVKQQEDEHKITI